MLVPIAMELEPAAKNHTKNWRQMLPKHAEHTFQFEMFKASLWNSYHRYEKSCKKLAQTAAKRTNY